MKRTVLIIAAVLTALAVLAPCVSAMAVDAALPLDVVALPGEGDLNWQLFRVTNPNSYEVDFTWGCTDSSDTGSGIVPAGGSTVVSVPAPYYAARTLYIVYSLNGMPSTLMRASTASYIVTVYYTDSSTGTVMHSESLTISESQSAISASAPESYSYGGASYVRTSNATLGHTYNAQGSQSDRTLTFYYVPAGTQSYTVRANYIDRATSSVVGSKSYTVKSGETVSITAPGSVTAGSNTEYKLNSSSKSSYTHTYGDSQTLYEFYYDEDTSSSAQPYMISVKLVSGSTVLTSRNLTVAVNGSVSYDVPATYTTGSGKVYTLDAGQPVTIVHDYTANNATRSYSIAYSSSSDAAPYDVIVNYVNALTGAKLRSTTLNVAVNATVTHEAPESFTENGETYTAVSGQTRSIVHQYSSTRRTYSVYYNAASAAPAEAYDITIIYARNDNNATLRSTTVTVPIQQSVYHTAPDSFVSGGLTYTIAEGQEATFRHDYSSSRRSYTIFYKLAGTTTAGDTVDFGETVVDDSEVIDTVVSGGSAAGTTGAATDQSADGSLAGQDTGAAEEPGVDDTAAGTTDTTDTNGGELVNVEDNETPLASISRSLSESTWGWIAVGFVFAEIALLAILGLRRAAARRKEERGE